jgi:HEAT repeat protein
MNKIGLYATLVVLILLAGCSSSKVPGSGEGATPELLPVEQVFETYKEIEAARLRRQPEDIKRIIGYTKHPDYLIRINAVKALSTDQLKSLPESETVLIDRLLNDDYWLVRAFAAKGLGKIRTQPAMDALNKQLAVEEDEKVKKHINKAIAGKPDDNKSRVPLSL